jgi:predicted RNase H-like nuclease (RuvC/YqgF family)
MKKHLILIAALALACALNADAPAPAVPKDSVFDETKYQTPESQDVRDYKAEGEVCQEALSQLQAMYVDLASKLDSVKNELKASQIEAQYYKILAAHNDLANKLALAGMQISSLQGQLAAAKERVAELEAQVPKP